ncbi:MAG: MATE family efflux transporter [Muribaculaceae bacterium]|nr:MATE family efflux transporter [Muribaculaceae bacterium]MCM1398965.1 MATE family efflux transporter [Clostridium sp.]MCM1458823.1 MATE family efflux transporter [Bacteroides sp.]
MQSNLTKGSVLKNLILFSLPYLLSSFLQTFYGLADLFIVGQYNGADSSSAVSVGSQVMHMVTLVIVGLAMGSTVMISQSVGAGNEKRAARAIGNTVTIFLLVSIIMTGVLLLCSDGIVTLMSTPDKAVGQTKTYLMICFAGIPFITAYNIISCILRGLGDSKSPMYFVAVACVFNVLIDVVLIGQLDMGAAGAALGTVISQTISVIVALIVLLKRDIGIKLTPTDFMIDKDVIAYIFKVGIPVSVQDLFIQISFIIITIIANRRGLIVSAAVGIVEKIIGFLFLIPSAMLAAISAIAAQNIGAGLHKRARETLRFGIIITVAFGILFSIICQFASPAIVDLFTDDRDVIRMGVQYLKSYVFDCALAAIHFCFSGYFCACGRSVYSFIHNIISALAIRIPGAYLVSKLFPDTLYPMGWAAPAGSFVSACICVVMYIYMRKQEKTETVDEKIFNVIEK